MSSTTDSILTSIKKQLGILEDYEHFDADIVLLINTAFGTLTQLGVGSDAGFSINDKAALWTDFTTDPLYLGQVKSYVYLKVRMVFDPPGTSFLLNAFQEEVKELEWRLNVQRESTQWTPPMPEELPEGRVIDGGVIR